MEYYLSINGQLVGPMSAQQVFAYNINPNTSLSNDGGMTWQPLYTYPDLMQMYHERQNGGHRDYHNGHRNDYDGELVDSKRIPCGVLAILLGTLGVQYFVIGKVGGGFLTILLSIVTCGTWSIITLIQGIMMLCMSDSEFERKYVESTAVLPIF